MESLPWEPSANAPELRRRVTERLKLIARNNGGAMTSLFMLLALRIHVDSVSYKPEVELALPSADPRQVADIFESRKPLAETRYEIMRVRLSAPAGFGATLRDEFNAEQTPLLMELVGGDGHPVTGSSARMLEPEDVDFSRLSELKLIGNDADVVRALVRGRLDWTGAATSRPAALFATPALVLAVIEAMDGPCSPCHAIARSLAFRLRGNQFAYPAVSENAAYPASGAQCSLAMRIRFDGDPKQRLRLLAVIKMPENAWQLGAPGSSFATADSLSEASTTYPARKVLAVGPGWKKDASFGLDASNSKVTVCVRPRQLPTGAPGTAAMRGQYEAVMVAATRMLAGLVQLEMPEVDIKESEPCIELSALLFLIHTEQAWRELLPAAVIDEFVAVVVGRWALALMTDAGWRADPFWSLFAKQPPQRFAELHTGRRNAEPLILAPAADEKRATETLDGLSVHYQKLFRAFSDHVRPWYSK